MTNLSQKLEQLSAAATQTEDDIRYYSGGSKYNEPLEQLKDRLVHLYRTGQLVAVQADDATVERVVAVIRDAMMSNDYPVSEWETDLAKAAISALAAKGDA